MAFGFMPPPPMEEEEEGVTPLMQNSYDAEVSAPAPPAGSPFPMEYGGDPGAAMQPPPPSFSTGAPPSWAETMKSASTGTPDFSQNIKRELAGVDEHMKSSPGGESNKWLSSLAPLLAGAAAVAGGYSNNDGISAILGGLSKGYSEHLMGKAKEQASLRQQSDSKTIDLAHKYMNELPGDVDPMKYPRLAELSQRMRESLINGKLSNPKEAQEFILEFTHYKNDIDKYHQDQKIEQKTREEQVPFSALMGGLEQTGLPADVIKQIMANKYGGVIPDPQNSGQWIDESVNTAREATARAKNTTAATDARSLADRTFRAGEGEKNRSAANARNAATISAGNKRAADRLGTGDKGYQSAYKAATSNALAVDKLRTRPNPQARKKDELDYMARAGHVVPLKMKDGSTGFYVGNGQVVTDRAQAEALVKGKGSLSMTPPPGEEDDFGEDPYGEE